MKKALFEEAINDSLIYWLPKTKDEISCLIDSSVADMVGFNQRNPHHCYDLFTHSLYTVAGIKDTAPVLLRVAAFFHDIGKPAVAMEKQGRLVFYGHAQKSAEFASPLLKEIGYREDEIKEICFYIKHHDDFISWVLPKEEYAHGNEYFVEITKDNLQRHIDKVKKKYSEDEFQADAQSWKNLLELCYADASAQADVVIQNGIVIDTKEHKLKKICALRKCLVR